MLIHDLLLASGTAAALFVMCLFARAGLGKLADLPRFEAVLADYRVLPAETLRVAARFIPVVELLAALLLFVPATRWTGGLMAAGLLTGYAVLIAHTLSQGRRLIDCGCGGEAEPLSLWLVLRNLALAAGLILAVSVPGTGAGGLWLEVAGLALAILMLSLWQLAETLGANMRRIRSLA